MMLQGERRTIAYFAWPNRDALIQGPEKKYPLISAADLMASEGNAYASRKNDDSWKEVRMIWYFACIGFSAGLNIASAKMACSLPVWLSLNVVLHSNACVYCLQHHAGGVWCIFESITQWFMSNQPHDGSYMHHLCLLVCQDWHSILS